MRALALFILMIFMVALIHFTGAAGADPMPQTILAFGFLIFAGYIAGCYAVKIGLPQISGYLIAGIVCGPYALRLVSYEIVLQLKLIDDLALALIAFTAGGEIKISRMRRCVLSIFSISIAQIIAIFAVVAVGSYLVLHFFNPFLMSTKILMVISGLIGTISAACSPATAIAVIIGTRSRGRMTDITIGVTIIKDVIVLLFFTLALAVGFAVSRGEIIEGSLIGKTLLMMFLSVLAGAAVGGGIVALLKFVRREIALFIITISLAVVFISELLGLHFIPICLMAGFLVENFSSLGDRLVGAIERTSMTVYIIFFAMAGVAIDFAALLQMWPYALAIVFLRLLGTALGTYIGGGIGRESDVLKKFGWMGFLSQVGVGLGFVVLVSRAFPEWGNTFRTIMLAVIAINQIIGPIALKVMLGLAGETAERHIEMLIRPKKRRNISQMMPIRQR